MTANEVFLLATDMFRPAETAFFPIEHGEKCRCTVQAEFPSDYNVYYIYPSVFRRK
jgi:hypothetical protein